jgi:hypothetical protein
VNKISLITGSAQNIQKPEASETKNAFVTPISTIKTIAFAMMHARGSQMTHPPHRQKKCQEQTIQARFFFDQTRFQVPSSAFAIRSG